MRRWERPKMYPPDCILAHNPARPCRPKGGFGLVMMMVMMMMVGQEGKIYSYSEQAGSINKDCCNSQSSPGRHSPKQFSAKDSYLFYIFWSISYFLPTVFDRGSSHKNCSLYLSVNQNSLKTWAEWYYSIRWPQCDGGSTKPYAICQEEGFKLV